jgi:hypothetical protein
MRPSAGVATANDNISTTKSRPSRLTDGSGAGQKQSPRLLPVFNVSASRTRLAQSFNAISKYKLDDHARRASKQYLSYKGAKFVLGKFPNYTWVASQIGGSKFQMAALAWKSSSSTERTVANFKAIDRAVASGKRIILASDPNKATGAYKKEIDYLKSKGYRISGDGLEMIK